MIERAKAGIRHILPKNAFARGVGVLVGGIVLLFAQVAGQSVGSTSLGRPALASPGFRQVSWRGIPRAAGRYRRFPIFLTWDGLFHRRNPRSALSAQMTHRRA